jgi:hypothetical protein
MMILAVIIAFVIGLLIGGYIFFWLTVTAYSMNKQDVIDALDKSISIDDDEKPISAKTTANAIEILIEQHGAKFIGWAADSDMFVSQGNTIEEVLKYASERFPGTEFTYGLAESKK